MNNDKADIKVIFGRNVKKYRTMQGLSQEAFIEQLGIGTSTISNIECGKSFPTPENINKIISVLKVPSYMLFSDNNSSDEEFALKDFQRRFDLIKNNKEKFDIMYCIIKAIT